MQIKRAAISDLDRIMEIYAGARAYMAASGNPDQWGPSYPDPELIRDDIGKGICYIICQEEIHGVFALMEGPDPSYQRIDNGAWLNDEPYVVIHRIAGDGAAHGILRHAADFCKGICNNVRIDTHGRNIRTQRQIEKNGFQRCGIIYVEDGTPRIAYHWTKKRPVLDRLLCLKDKSSAYNRRPFHMPGHKRNMTGPFGEIAAMDVTEITDFDDLHNPSGVIRESMDLLKKTYGTRESWYLVNGSSVGILASVSALCRIHDHILVAANCHRCVFHAIDLLELCASFAEPDIDGKTGLAAGLSAEKVRKCLEEDPEIRACVITSPTYEGVTADVRSISAVCREFGVVLIVDEAHGAHFPFHEYFPESAVSCGADLVVQSAHKTLPALTQTALLHLCTDAVDPGLIRKYLSVYETSSPSYLMIASCEYAVSVMRDEREKVESYVNNLDAFRRKCKSLLRLRLFGPENGSTADCYDYDRGKLVFLSPFGGRDLFDRLEKDYRIEAEMAGAYHVICMTSVCDRKEDFDALYRAIREIDSSTDERVRAVDYGPAGRSREERETEKSGTDSDDPGCQPVPGRSGCCRFREREDQGGDVDSRSRKCEDRGKDMYCRSWECRGKKMEDLPYQEAEGRAAGEYVMLYPPGIPLIMPGQVITADHIDRIESYIRSGFTLRGLKDGRITVIEAPIPLQAPFRVCCAGKGSGRKEG